MGNLHLVTGYQGHEHITAADHGSLYAGIFGAGNYVLNRGKKLAAAVITNNLVRIADGDIVLQGRHIRLNEGATVDLNIQNGTQGYFRNDLIVARYSREASTGIERASLEVIKGTAAASDPTDPEYNNGDLLNENAETVDFPLYRIPLDGITVGTPVQLFEVVSLAMVGEDGKIASSYLPALDYIPTKQKGTVNGVAPLNANRKIDSGYLPLSDSISSPSSSEVATSMAVFNLAAALPTNEVLSGGTGGFGSIQTYSYYAAKIGNVVVCSGYITLPEETQVASFALDEITDKTFSDQIIPVMLICTSGKQDVRIVRYHPSNSTLVCGSITEDKLPAGTHHFTFSFVTV